ncbi:MAG TPA: BadF/BadG/BcrA/BcrD ATPase family protein [Vicinamibacterales bacterium]
MHVLGIDAGGTKTVCLLADEGGQVIAEARGGGANLQSVGELEVEKVLHGVMESAVAGRNVTPSAICLGIAGVDRPTDTETIRSIMRRIGYKSRAIVVNDALVALEAGANDQPGVVIVAGTGSIAYGRNGSAQAARAGGWGYLIGDEGGGFWIGRSALASVVRQFDGRGPATQLTELILRHMGLASPTELIHEIYYRDLHRRAIAGLAALVHQAAANGDAVAAQILGRAGTELAAAAASVITRLGMRGDAFPTILAGGIFRGVPLLARDMETRLSEIAPRSTVRLLEVEPAVGAVRLALAAARGQVSVPSYV